MCGLYPSEINKLDELLESFLSTCQNLGQWEYKEINSFVKDKWRSQGIVWNNKNKNNDSNNNNNTWQKKRLSNGFFIVTLSDWLILFTYFH